MTTALPGVIPGAMSEQHLASCHSAAADANTDETNALVNSLRDQLSQAYADAERDRQVWQNELSSMREVFGSAEKQRCRNQQTLSCQIVALRLREHFISLRGCIQLWALNVVNHGRSVLATRLHNFERQLADDRSCEPYEIEAKQLLSESSCWSEASSRTQSPIGTPSHSSTSPLSIAIPADKPDLIATTDSEHAYRCWFRIALVQFFNSCSLIAGIGRLADDHRSSNRRLVRLSL